MQAAAGVADALDEQTLDEGMDILVGRLIEQQRPCTNGASDRFQPLDDRAVIFIIQTDADRWEPPPSSKPTWISLLVGIGVYATTPSPFSLVAAVVAWWLVRKILKRMTGTTRPKIRGTQFIISPQDARGPDGTVVPVSEIKEVVWRDWAGR